MVTLIRFTPYVSPFLIGSYRHNSNRVRKHLLCRGGSTSVILGRRLPLCMPHRFGRGFHLLVRDAVRLQGVTAERSKRRGRIVPGDDADWVHDRPQRVHGRLQ